MPLELVVENIQVVSDKQELVDELLQLFPLHQVKL
jgi:hypothetical protein